jgi:sugar phosphate isomerase/epimerase
MMLGLAALTLGTVAAGRAPAAQGVDAEAGRAALRKLGWRLACQAWTFRELTAFETLYTLNRLGIRYIEFFPGQRLGKDFGDAKLDHNMSQEHLDAVIKKLGECRVRAVNYGVVGLPNNEAEARKVFEFAKKLNLRTIVSEPPEEAIPLLDRLAQEYEINVAIHDHPKPSHYWNPETVLKVSEGRSKRIGACADTGHWHRSGLSPVESLKKLEGRVISFHLKDLDTSKEDVPWGTGGSEVRGVLAEVKRQGTKPVFSIEFERTSGAELIANVEKCRDYLYSVAPEFASDK